MNNGLNLIKIGGLNTTDIVLILIFIGLALAAIGMFCHKYFLGKFLDKMVKEGINTPENAKTLKSLGANFLVRRAITNSASVRRLFGFVQGEEVCNDPHKLLQKKDKNELRFYLLTEKEAEATTRFPKDGNSPLSLVISLVLIVAGYFVCDRILPLLLEMIDSFFPSN